MKINRKKGIISFLAIAIILLSFKTYYISPKLKYTKDYIPKEGNIKGEVQRNYFLSKGKDFDIGANEEGYAVFKNPAKALKKLKTDYTVGLTLIKKEFNLLPINQFNYESFGTYGWQVTSGTKEEREQAVFVSEFIDIYENSFK